MITKTKTKMKRTIQLALFTLLGYGVSAQTLENVNLLNTTGLYGSPRYVGMGGAFMALGNDLSALQLNPAAGAVYRNDNFGLALGFQAQTNSTTFLNASQDDNSLDGVFQNIGWVKKFGKNNKFAFSLSYNRLADFNTNYSARGINTYNSSGNIETGFTLGEYWLGAARGLTVNELASAGLLEEASAASADILLTAEDANGDSRVVAFDYVDDATIVNYNYAENGGRSEFNINFGGAANKNFYWGAGIGIPTLNYAVATTLGEAGFADTSYFSSVELSRSNVVDATGINLHAGIIYRPTQALRLAASYQSPTWYKVDEVYSLQAQGYGRDGTILNGTEYIFDDISYGAMTPSIYRLGIATVIGKHAIISSDFEYTDPSKTTLNGKNNNNYEGDEDYYQNETQSTYAFKLGGELRFGPGYVRAGYQHRASNFVDPDNYRTASDSYSVGLGFKKGALGFDIGYVFTSYSQDYLSHPYLAYAVSNGNSVEGFDVDRAVVENKVTTGNLIFGINWSF